MPIMKGRVNGDTIDLDRFKTEAPLYVLVYLYFIKWGVDAQKLPKRTANICTDL